MQPFGVFGNLLIAHAMTVYLKKSQCRQKNKSFYFVFSLYVYFYSNLNTEADIFPISEYKKKKGNQVRDRDVSNKVLFTTLGQLWPTRLFYQEKSKVISINYDNIIWHIFHCLTSVKIVWKIYRTFFIFLFSNNQLIKCIVCNCYI